MGYGTDIFGKDYWLVKNSWGYWWGTQGYVKIVRNKNGKCGVPVSTTYFRYLDAALYVYCKYRYMMYTLYVLSVINFFFRPATLNIKPSTINMLMIFVGPSCIPRIRLEVLEIV
jgi:hypothetical protein